MHSKARAKSKKAERRIGKQMHANSSIELLQVIQAIGGVANHVVRDHLVGRRSSPEKRAKTWQRSAFSLRWCKVDIKPTKDAQRLLKNHDS